MYFHTKACLNFLSGHKERLIYGHDDIVTIISWSQGCHTMYPFPTVKCNDEHWDVRPRDGEKRFNNICGTAAASPPPIIEHIDMRGGGGGDGGYRKTKSNLWSEAVRWFMDVCGDGPRNRGVRITILRT